MSREAVRLLAQSGKTMKSYFEDKFHQAVYTDMHIHTDEPDAMISIFIMEQEAHWIVKQLQPIMAEMALMVVEDGLKELFHDFTS